MVLVGRVALQAARLPPSGGGSSRDPGCGEGKSNKGGASKGGRVSRCIVCSGRPWGLGAMALAMVSGARATLLGATPLGYPCWWQTWGGGSAQSVCAAGLVGSGAHQGAKANGLPVWELVCGGLGGQRGAVGAQAGGGCRQWSQAGAGAKGGARGGYGGAGGLWAHWAGKGWVVGGSNGNQRG